MLEGQILLVEGNDDVHVFYNLFEQYDVPETFRVKNKEGISKLINELDVELLASDLKSLGIVVDADTNLVGRWNSITSRLERCGYVDLPKEPVAEGIIISQDFLPKVGIWLMPDNQINGMLEDFIAYLVPPNDELWNYAKDVVENIKPENKLFRSHTAKANIHTWLAWQEQPGVPMGSAIKMQYLNGSSPHAKIFVDWIRNMFCS